MAVSSAPTLSHLTSVYLLFRATSDVRGMVLAAYSIENKRFGLI